MSCHKVMQMQPDIGLLITSLFQDVKTSFVTSVCTVNANIHTMFYRMCMQSLIWHMKRILIHLFNHIHKAFKE